MADLDIDEIVDCLIEAGQITKLIEKDSKGVENLKIIGERMVHYGERCGMSKNQVHDIYNQVIAKGWTGKDTCDIREEILNHARDMAITNASEYVRKTGVRMGYRWEPDKKRLSRRASEDKKKDAE